MRVGSAIKESKQSRKHQSPEDLSGPVVLDSEIEHWRHLSWHRWKTWYLEGTPA